VRDDGAIVSGVLLEVTAARALPRSPTTPAAIDERIEESTVASALA
jgi:hypothetical protein